VEGGIKDTERERKGNATKERIKEVREKKSKLFYRRNFKIQDVNSHS
jgi:hypothetical protein